MTMETVQLVNPVDSGDVVTAFKAYGNLMADRQLGSLGGLCLVEDAAQETFLRAWRNRDSYQPSHGAMRAWLTTLNERAAIDILRTVYKHKKMDRLGGLLYDERETYEFEDEAIERCDAEASGILAQLRELAPTKRGETIWTNVVDDRTHTETAKLLNLPLGTVKEHIRAGRRRLREMQPEETKELSDAAYTGRMRAVSLTENHPRVSEQVSKPQLEKILEELQLVIESESEGAVVEFGCYIGTTSLFIRRLLNAYQDSRAFHVYDSFEGLPEKAAQDVSSVGEQFKAGELRVGKKLFQYEFKRAQLKLPEIHKGWFSDLTNEDIPEKIAFAFLDGDFYESIRDSLNLVLPRMQPGSTIIIDDYAREALPGVARAVQEFLPKNLHMRLRVVNNQAIIRL